MASVTDMHYVQLAVMEFLVAEKKYLGKHTRAVQKVSDLNFFRLNKSSTGSVLHCGYGGDIYAHA